MRVVFEDIPRFKKLMYSLKYASSSAEAYLVIDKDGLKFRTSDPHVSVSFRIKKEACTIFDVESTKQVIINPKDVLSFLKRHVKRVEIELENEIKFYDSEKKLIFSYSVSEA